MTTDPIPTATPATHEHCVTAPGVRAKVSETVHGWDDANGVCVAMLVVRVYEQQQQLGVGPGSVDAYLQLVDPRNPGGRARGYRHDRSPGKVAHQGYAPTVFSWHRVAECPRHQ